MSSTNFDKDDGTTSSISGRRGNKNAVHRNSREQNNNSDNGTSAVVGTTSESDNDLIDKLLAEGVKLKKKCKELRMTIVQMETQRAEDREEFENFLNSRDSEVCYQQPLNL